ncbi:MAG: YifB family Mg chelatase-like AAA ATPase [Clostridiaceae bacterium]|jgi:magnesium chelatase family protein|nr:YifB family Mg chelatase-like AAA ATPase [Clostridiaceae bacterium]
MLAKVKSYALIGLNGAEVEIEVDINAGLPVVDIVGLAGTAIKESKERIRSAIKNSGFMYPIKRVTVNLAPADLKKDGPWFDLAIAVAMLAASEQVTGRGYKDFVFLGELSLDGGVRKIDGVMPVLISAVQNGHTRFVVPSGNAVEAGYIENAEVYAVDSLSDVVALINGTGEFSPVVGRSFDAAVNSFVLGADFSEVKGQLFAKRGLEIAVSGGHNVIMTGPPGAGKTMLARCVPGIMPDLTFKEAIEITKIHSIAGILDAEKGIVTSRPFRTPHHTTTVPTIVGGGMKSKPGEVSLANLGVLFLDEMPEYPRAVLEALRQPLEDRRVTVARVQRTVDYPANFVLIASMNPCPCGNYGSKTAECRCTATQIHNYLSKLSGPLMDRIDLQIEVDGITYVELRGGGDGENSAAIKVRANHAREVQRARFATDGISMNAEMSNSMIKKYCGLDTDGERLLDRAFQRLNMSARGATRVLKVARTIADLEGAKDILPKHVAEAIQYRSLDRKYNA